MLLISIPLILLSYFFIDKSVAYFAFEHDKSLSPIFETLSHGADSTFWLVGSALLWIFYRFYKKNSYRAKQMSFMFISVATTGVVVNIVKMFFGKARPILLKKEQIFGFEWFVPPSAYDYHSFPSGHTTTAFSIATVLTLMFPRYWALFYIYATTMALSRVLNWNHYVSDVIAGAVLGTLVTLLLFKIKNITFKEFKEY